MMLWCGEELKENMFFSLYHQTFPRPYLGIVSVVRVSVANHGGRF